MPILIRGAGGGGASLQSKVVTPSSKQQIILPDSGYDGLDKVTVAAEKSVYCKSSNWKTASTINNAGQYLALTGISNMMPYDKTDQVMNLVDIVIIKSLDSSKCTGTEFTDMILSLQKNNYTTNKFDAVVLMYRTANYSGMTSNPGASWGMCDVTYVQNNNRLEVKIFDYQFNKTDNPMKFCTTTDYEYIALLAERPS